jgi:hypothetical protein
MDPGAARHWSPGFRNRGRFMRSSTLLFALLLFDGTQK